MPSAVQSKPEKSKLRRSHSPREDLTASAAPSLSPSQSSTDDHQRRAGADLAADQEYRDTHCHPVGGTLPGSQRCLEAQVVRAPGDFNLRAHTREFMEDQDMSDMDTLVQSWAQSIPFDHLRDALASFGREYLRQFIVSRRTSAVSSNGHRVGPPKWSQGREADPFDRLKDYVLVTPEGGWLCVLDCTPSQIRYNVTLRRKQANATLQEAERLNALAEATEKARRKTPRALNPQKVFEILERKSDGDE